MRRYNVTENQHKLIVTSEGILYENNKQPELEFGDDLEVPLDQQQTKGKLEKSSGSKAKPLDDILKFSGVQLSPSGNHKVVGNSKIDHASFSLPSGHTCVGAKDCKSCADRTTGSIEDAEGIKFRCFSASQENVWKSLRMMRWHNYDLLKQTKGIKDMVELINKSYNWYFPNGIEVLRLHIGGDFYSNIYFSAWLEMARQHPTLEIYAYTKSLPFWVKNKKNIPPNVILTASKGGKHDHLIDTENLKSAEVVYSPEEAKEKGLDVDHDDSHARARGGNESSFALTVHGQQPKDSEAGLARSALRKRGIMGYGSKKKVKENNQKYKITEGQY